MIHLYGNKYLKSNNSIVNIHLSTTNVEGLSSRLENIEKTVNLYSNKDEIHEKNTPYFQTPNNETTPVVHYPQISPSNLNEKVNIFISFHSFLSFCSFTFFLYF